MLIKKKACTASEIAIETHLMIDCKKLLFCNLYLLTGGGKAPVLSSHQRQLSLQLSQVQERLIKNKTLLTAVEPAITCTSLEVS